MAEASGSRTHRRQENLPPAGFEDREDHRTPCASVLFISTTNQTTYKQLCWLPKISLLAVLLAVECLCMKNTYQRGTIYEASNSFFVRYFTTDGAKRRVS